MSFCWSVQGGQGEDGKVLRSTGEEIPDLCVVITASAW